MTFKLRQSVLLIASLFLASCGGDAQAPGGNAAPKFFASLNGAVQEEAQAEKFHLGDAPTAPAIAPARERPAGKLGLPAQVLTLDTQDREAVRDFFNGLFDQSNNVPMGWTGNYDTGNEGTTSDAYKQAVALRINMLRAMAGVPANISFFADYSAKAQKAALMMSANGMLDHYPTASWIYYSEDGAKAASSSNLSLGRHGADAVTYGYLIDPGANNTRVGHRRWLFYPQTQLMGTGDVPVGSRAGVQLYGANALWVFDSNMNMPRPTVRDDFVAWPPKGYVPYQLVPGRWSFSYPRADFAAATVTVSKGGVNIPVTLEALANGYGENTIVWLLQGTTDSIAWAKPDADEKYAVTIANVMIDGKARSFSYEVAIFDSAKATPGAASAAVTLPASAYQGSTISAGIVQLKNATGYELAVYPLRDVPQPYRPANSSADWVASNAYATFVGSEMRVTHGSNSGPTPYFTTSGQFYVNANAALEFSSRAVLTTSQAGTVQVSEDGGSSWADLLTEVGTGSTATTSNKTVSLAGYAGKLIKVRFKVGAASGGSYSYYLGDGAGWFVSNISMQNLAPTGSVSLVSAPAGATSASLSVPASGTVAVAAHAQYQGSYYGSWGKLALLNALPTSFDGNRIAYQLTYKDGAYQVSADGKLVATVPAAIGAIRFKDMSVNLGIAAKSKSIPAADLKRLIELYIAFFNRVPDADGLDYWIGQRKAGSSLDAIGDAFYRAALNFSAQTGYTASMSNADFVRLIYKNVLGRADSTAPPDADVQYWASRLASGTTKASLIGTMLDVAHGFKGNAQWGWVADLLDNKIDVGTFYAITQAITFTDAQVSVSKGMEIAAAVTSTDVTAAKAVVPTQGGFSVQ